MNSIVVVIYLLIVNILAFTVFGIDKYKAKHSKWRIPEAHLVLIAVAGGSVGALCGMYSFHHKTNVLLFYLGVPLILTAQLTLALLLFNYSTAIST